MAAVALQLHTMPDQPHRPYRPDAEFGELGFTQADRDAVLETAWNVKDIRNRLEIIQIRLAKVEDERAHKADLKELRDDWESGHKELAEQIMSMRLKLAVWSGGIGALVAIEQVLIKLFWH